MTVGLNNTALLDLPLPVEGYFDGTWGDLVNNALTNYLDIAIAGTSAFTGDGAVTLDNTAGDDSVSNITANSGQYAFIRVAGTLTTTKIITVGTAGSPAVSKSYIVDNAATGGTVTFKAYGQTGVSVAVGEKCFVYFNGTDYVKVASSVADGVTSVAGTGNVNGITLTGTVTSTGNLTLGGTLSGVNLASQVTGTLPILNGGTGTTSTTFANLTTNVTGTLPIANGGTGTTSTTFANLTTNVTGTLPILNGGTGSTTANLTAGSGVTISGTWPNQTIAATGSGGTITSVTASSPLASSGGTTPNISFTGTLPVANGGTGTSTPALVQGSGVTISGTWPNQTIAATGSGGTITGVTASSPLASSGGTAPNISITSSTGSGAVVLATTPTLVTPILGTPQSATLTNATDLPISTGVSGLGTGVATFLATPSSSNLLAAVTDETGTGSLVFATSPTLVTPLLGTPTSGNLANCTFPTLNQNTTGTAASTPKLLTTNFTIEESGGALLIKYGATTVLSISSAGAVISASNVTAYGTP